MSSVINFPVYCVKKVVLAVVSQVSLLCPLCCWEVVVLTCPPIRYLFQNPGQSLLSKSLEQIKCQFLTLQVQQCSLIVATHITHLDIMVSHNPSVSLQFIPPLGILFVPSLSSGSLCVVCQGVELHLLSVIYLLLPFSLHACNPSSN